MKIIKIYSILGLCMIIFNSCVAQDDVAHMKVNIENISKDSPIIRVNFINDSSSVFFISKYAFCNGGVIVQDLFLVGEKDGTKHDKAYYGGVVDFYDPNNIQGKMFFSIKPMEKLSCEVDISRYYFSYESRRFQIVYNAENPSFENQKAIELISNKIDVVLPASAPSMNGNLGVE